jgi:hypothetical protein
LSKTAEAKKPVFKKILTQVKNNNKIDVYSEESRWLFALIVKLDNLPRRRVFSLDFGYAEVEDPGFA